MVCCEGNPSFHKCTSHRVVFSMRRRRTPRLTSADVASPRSFRDPQLLRPPPHQHPASGPQPRSRVRLPPARMRSSLCVCSRSGAVAARGPPRPFLGGAMMKGTAPCHLRVTASGVGRRGPALGGSQAGHVAEGDNAAPPTPQPRSPAPNTLSQPPEVGAPPAHRTASTPANQTHRGRGPGNRSGA